MVFESTAGANGRDLFVARRSDRSAPWTSITPIAEANTTAMEASPYMSPDKLTLYFDSDRSGSAAFDLVARRGTIDETFGTPARLTELDTTQDEFDPQLTIDQRTIVFSRGGDLFWAQR